MTAEVEVRTMSFEVGDAETGIRVDVQRVTTKPGPSGWAPADEWHLECRAPSGDVFEAGAPDQEQATERARALIEEVVHFQACRRQVNRQRERIHDLIRNWADVDRVVAAGHQAPGEEASDAR